MADLISKSKLTVHLSQMSLWCKGAWYVRSGDIKHIIDAEPIIEAEPVRHGRWIDHEYKEFPIGRYECSVCGAKHDMEWDYCPNCGARMDEGRSTTRQVNPQEQSI